MRYHVKKIIFFFLSMLSIGSLLYLIGIYMYDTVANRLLEDVLGIGDYFTTDKGIFPVMFSYVSICVLALASLLFYRKEVSLWPKLLLLASGSVTPFIYGEIYDHYFGLGFSAVKSPWSWEAALTNSIFAIFTLVSMVGLIIVLIKYPKATDKMVSAT